MPCLATYFHIIGGIQGERVNVGHCEHGSITVDMEHGSITVDMEHGSITVDMKVNICHICVVFVVACCV